MQICIDPLRAGGIGPNLHRWIHAHLHQSPRPRGGSMKICIDPSMQLCIHPSMQICIDPPSIGGIDANLHRSIDANFHRCKFASIPPGLGGSMQICIHPPSLGQIDANLHRSPQGVTDRCKFASIPSGLVGSMQICIHGSMQICIDGSMQICINPPSIGKIDANFHRSPQRGWDRCKFASIPPGRGDGSKFSFQTRVSPMALSARGIDANLHRSPQRWGDRANLHRSPQRWWDRCKFASMPLGLGGSMQICIDPLRTCRIDANLHRRIYANFH